MTSGSNKVRAPKVRAMRHIPQRTCVGCRQSTAKRRLVRVVRLPDGSVQVDPTGKKSGRGVYLCWDRHCWESGLKGKGLERGLRTSISPADRAALESYGREAPEGKYEGAYPPLRGVP